MENQVNCKYIVFFDGYCGLCSKAVNFIIKHDKNKKFKYSPLQGEFIKTISFNNDKHKVKDIINLDTICLYNGPSLFIKTQAWRIILKELGGGYRLLYYLSYLLPAIILDQFYDLIAKNRYAFFGRLPHCRVPSETEKDLFVK